MKTMLRKIVKWVIAAVFLLVAIKLVGGILEWNDFHSGHHFQPQFGFGPGGYGHPHFNRLHHPMGGFHFLWPVAYIAFWGAVIVLLIKCWRKRVHTSRFQHSITDVPLSYHLHKGSSYQADFLDEWEKNQTRHKEEQ